MWFVIYSEFRMNLVICDIYKCGLWYIVVDFWFVIYTCFVAYMEKQKTKKKFKVASPSAWAAALGEESFFPECLDCGAQRRGCLSRVPGLRRPEKRVSVPSAWAVALGEEGVFPECLDCGARGRGCLSRVLHSRKIFLKKETTSAAPNGVNSSPSARTALGKAFSECTIFGSRGRRLSRKEIPQSLFPECCTRGRLPRVHLTLGEATASCSDYTICL